MRDGEEDEGFCLETLMVVQDGPTDGGDGVYLIQPTGWASHHNGRCGCISAGVISAEIGKAKPENGTIKRIYPACMQGDCIFKIWASKTIPLGHASTNTQLGIVLRIVNKTPVQWPVPVIVDTLVVIYVYIICSFF